MMGTHQPTGRVMGVSIFHFFLAVIVRISHWRRRVDQMYHMILYVAFKRNITLVCLIIV